MPTQFEEYGPTLEEVSAVIEALFRKEGWHYSRTESGEFYITFARVSLVLRYIVERRCLMVACRNLEYTPGSGPDALPPERLLPIAHLLLDANFNLLLGKFTRDDRDGEISLETAVPLVGGQLTEQMLDHALGATVSSYREYHPKIAALKYGPLPAPGDSPGPEPLRF